MFRQEEQKETGTTPRKRQPIEYSTAPISAETRNGRFVHVSDKIRYKRETARFEPSIKYFEEVGSRLVHGTPLRKKRKRHRTWHTTPAILPTPAPEILHPEPSSYEHINRLQKTTPISVLSKYKGIETKEFTTRIEKTKTQLIMVLKVTMFDFFL